MGRTIPVSRRKETAVDAGVTPSAFGNCTAR